MKLTEIKHPPQPRLAFHVGVTGHRPAGLQEGDAGMVREVMGLLLDAIRDTVGEMSARLRDRFRDEEPVLRIVSSLAEGTDRIVAETALGKGYELHAPLPFHRETYETDFESPESCDKFRGLLQRATAVMELDGSRATPDQANDAYEAAGSVL